MTARALTGKELAAVIAICDHHGVELAGRDVTVVGRSLVVGSRWRFADEPGCHGDRLRSRTRDLATVPRRADASVADHVAALTPVPGGVGPVTTALLLAHTVTAASRASGLARRLPHLAPRG